MEQQLALHRRRPVGTGTLGFASACMVLSLALVIFDGIGTGVGASGVPSLGHHAVQLSATPTQTNDVPPVRPAPQTAPASPVAVETSTPAAAPTPAPAPTPPPPTAATTGLPPRGAATAAGCGPALAYLQAYSAPGFTFECPGYALGHEAMTCINTSGVCDNEHLIAISDPCAAAYMNEASNSWVLTGASDAPIDPYGACP